MYHLMKTVNIAGAHHLPGYEGPCCKVHGHSWQLTIECIAEELNDEGMVVDFSEIKRICNQLDHEDLNKFIQNPTAENIAKWLFDRIPQCISVSVEESPGSIITYSPTHQQGAEENEHSAGNI